MEDSINSAVPASAGALLAEEWTINPMATLPSFLEMFMIDEANRSARKSLDAGMGIMAQKLAIQARALQAQAAQPSTTSTSQNRHSSRQTQRQRQRQQGTMPPTTTTTSTSSNSSGLSLFFSKLIALLQNSAEKFASTMALLMERFGPEISFVILYALERRCLRSEACATISESLYGGRQTKIDFSSSPPASKDGSNNSRGQPQQRKLLPLTDHDKTRYALLVTVLPYLRQRLLLWYQKIKRQHQQSSSSSSSLRPETHTLLSKLKKMFVWIYPMLHLSMSGLDLFYQWRYMLGHSVFFTPSSHLLGLVVRRATMEDTQQQQKPKATTAMGDQVTTTTRSAINNNGRGAPPTPAGMIDPSFATTTPPTTTNTSSTLRNLTVVGLSTAVILSWVSHFRAEFQRQRQDLIMQQQQQQQQQQQAQGNATNLTRRQQQQQFYHSNQTGGTSTISTTTIPPPPPPGMMMMNNNHAAAAAMMPPHLCPLCRQPRVNPTASSSGFVFCYKCLLLHIKEKGSCPVTGRTCKEAQLLRLYEPSTPANDTN